jgi:hypothetical protein
MTELVILQEDEAAALREVYGQFLAYLREKYCNCSNNRGMNQKFDRESQKKA